MATGAEPSAAEDTCAWYGHARQGVLYFGESAFWSALREHGDPQADLRAPGPQRVGRFDLRAERLLPALEVGAPDARAGVWDVHAHENGRVYYTTFFEEMGSVDPASGAVSRYPALGRGLNEIAPGPDGTLLVSRYGPLDGRRGSVLWISPAGERIRELALEPPPGWITAPKTVAFDPVEREIWVTMDLLPEGAGEIRHDAYVLAPDGRELRRIAEPEIQFVAAAPDGSLLRAEVEGSRLWLWRRGPDGDPQRILLDAAFARDLDFVQDIQPGPGGVVLVTRWSGFVHRLDPDGSLRSLRLPDLVPGGLYYSGVVSGERACATYCAGIRVVCQSLPPGGLR